MDIYLLENKNNFPIPLHHCINWINGPKKLLTVALQCPTCKKAFCLANHNIDKYGSVTPSVVCPFNCGFHDFLRIIK